MRKLSTALLFTLLLGIIIVSSCSKSNYMLLDKESLFEIRYGRMEDQIVIDQAGKNYTPRKNRIFMKNGLFYISNGFSCKVMEFNSYGEILNLYYNEEKNPAPVILQKTSDETTTSTRNVYSYPFLDVGEIGIDSRKQLFIDDKIAENRIEMDEELGVPLDRIILQFDQSGHYIDYLGQEGSGGTPFSYIEKIRITLRDELVVFTRNPGGWRIFWFSNQGRPLYVVDIKSDVLPFKDEHAKGYSFADLETIECDDRERLLFVKVDYYIDHSKSGDSEETGIAFQNSLIWTLKVAEGEFTKFTEIPLFVKARKEPRVYEEEDTSLLYEFLGISGDGVFFLMSLDGENNYNLILLTREGKVLENTEINLGEDRLMLKEFYVGQNGLLTGLLCWEENAEVVWWRTDKIIKTDG